MIDTILCYDCGLFHKLPEDLGQKIASAHGFRERHEGHRLGLAPKIDGLSALPYGLGDWRGNADIKLAYQAVQTPTVTNLQSLASSATAGWQGAVIDNTSNLFEDFLHMFVLDHANTAPANSKGSYLFFYGGLDTTYTNPASGSEGAITLVDVTANPQALREAAFLPYTTQDEVAEYGPFSARSAFGGTMPPKHGPVIINHSGAALAGSGNIWTYRGVYRTVI